MRLCMQSTTSLLNEKFITLYRNNYTTNVQQFRHSLPDNVCVCVCVVSVCLFQCWAV